MSPMLNSQYFQPMQHRPLPDIRKYALISNNKGEYYAVTKPEGIDIYVNKGKMYDFNNNEILSTYLTFHFEKLLQTSINVQGTIVGVLTSSNAEKLKSYKHTLYNKTRSVIPNAEFVVYDIIFPVFNIDHVYKMRFDIADKVVGVLPNCRTASMEIIKTEHELSKIVIKVFSIDTAASILVYNTEGSFVPGISQLTWEDADTVSYIIKANQLYRGHIKRVVSTTFRFDNGDKFDIATRIVARFKKEYIDVPLDTTNIALCRYIWENKITLKEFPFWFTGYTVFDNKEGKSEYITLINEFLSFIPPTE